MTRLLRSGRAHYWRLKVGFGFEASLPFGNVAGWFFCVGTRRSTRQRRPGKKEAARRQGLCSKQQTKLLKRPQVEAAGLTSAKHHQCHKRGMERFRLRFANPWPDTKPTSPHPEGSKIRAAGRHGPDMPNERHNASRRCTGFFVLQSTSSA